VGAQLRLRETHELLRNLPAGEPHRVARPEGSPSSWPTLTPATRQARAMGA
jgi:hypothetical protein